ncbi:Macrolide export ATP-binding/permease protein MacB [Pseudobythopirellula maris]|uniref:Macrolide export ATP-binding/permease protein MacB n=1 Tax=Pseudobythopirellula maris TaxID=2527991 RepID=A0A5C5ZJH9_9BACT|nr:ABC transporter permease [Pseudobythopirellula maris]TWT87348.1 Macrolide export ATP-binding/permease protein MacB [Pseudobythopirellula maris]
MTRSRIGRTIWLSIKSLMLHPLRSGLTVLGILIGVSSVIWLLAIGEGISAASQRQIASLGARNIIVRSVMPTSDNFEGGGYGLTRDDYQRIVETVPTLETAVPIREFQREVRSGRRRLEGRMVGCTPEYPGVVKTTVAQGRFFNQEDMDDESNYCVLAAEASEYLYPGGNSLGRALMVDDEFYTVIGVMDPRAASAGIGGSLAAEDFSNDIYIPISTLWRRLGDMEIIQKPGQFQQDVKEISQITMAVADVDDVLKTAEVVRDTVQRGHTLDDFTITVPLELLNQARTTQLMFIIFLGMIAAISLVVGGIGIMNIMLATVTERTREIGIRRAVGAKQGDIVSQFLAESVVLSVVGGALGVVGGLFCRPLSIGGREMMYRFFPDQMENVPDLIRTVEPVMVGWSVPLAFIISAMVGVVFGVYPAIKAAKLDPIVALRHE